MRSPLVLVALCGLLMPVAATSGDGSRDGPSYARRLQMPARTETFARPRAVTADLHTGELFLADTGNHRIVIFDRRDTFRYQIPGGQNFRSPIDVAVGPEGYLFVLATHAGQRALLLLDFDGLFIETVALRTADGKVDAAGLVSVALSPAGDRLFVLDQGALKLWIADRSGRVLRAIDLASGLSEEQAQETLLGHVDVYGDTVLVALPTEGVVRLLDLEGSELGRVGNKGSGPRQTGFPVAAALDAEGNLFIIDKQRMMFTLWEPGANRCIGEFYGIGRAPGAMYNPEDLTLDADGRIYVSQGFEGRVQVYAGARPASGVARGETTKEAPSPAAQDPD